MPDTSVSRQKFVITLKVRISLVSVATYFDIPRQDLIDYLNGKIKVKAHETLLAIIDFTKSDRRNENGKFLRYIFKNFLYNIIEKS